MKLSGTVLVFGALILCFAGLLSVSPAAWASEQQVQYFPQLGDGGGYATTWYFTGLGFGSNIVTVELFDKSGHPLMLATDMGTSSIFRFTLDGSGSASLRTLSAGNSVKTGWAKVTSSQPVGATEIFKYIGNNGGITCQAAVLPSDPIEVEHDIKRRLPIFCGRPHIHDSRWQVFQRIDGQDLLINRPFCIERALL